MYKVGFIDDDNLSFRYYQYSLSEYEIELICTNEEMDKGKVLDWILKNRIECMLIDYKLKPKYSYVGTELLAYINEHLPGLQCMILTSHSQSSIDEKLVPKELTVERKVFQELDMSEFADRLKYNVIIFRNRMKLLSERFDDLFERKKNSISSIDEDEEFNHLYTILKSYGEIDDIPLSFFNDKTNEKLDEILEQLDMVLKNE